jgi:N-acetylmuramic acid 6-phosphate etherase
VISGGYETLVLSREGVEDHRQAAVSDLKNHRLDQRDFVIGIAASRRTPYTLAGLQYAQSVSARTAYIICNRPDEACASDAVIKKLDVLISLPVGPEAITGSTRMKSGSAQKMALNAISTTAMVLLGKTYGNLMVDLQARSEKLHARSRKILIDLFEMNIDEAESLLKASGGSVKIAIVMHKLDCTCEDAERRLRAAGGFVSRITDA